LAQNLLAAARVTLADMFLLEGSRTGSDDDETLPVSYHKLSANHNHTASRYTTAASISVTSGGAVKPLSIM
jgi:hypothetical protein